MISPFGKVVHYGLSLKYWLKKKKGAFPVGTYMSSFSLSSCLGKVKTIHDMFWIMRSMFSSVDILRVEVFCGVTAWLLCSFLLPFSLNLDELVNFYFYLGFCGRFFLFVCWSIERTVLLLKSHLATKTRVTLAQLPYRSAVNSRGSLFNSWHQHKVFEMLLERHKGGLDIRELSWQLLY